MESEWRKYTMIYSKEANIVIFKKIPNAIEGHKMAATFL
jgi:hypothetical protein